MVGCKNVNGIWEECSVNLPPSKKSSVVYYTYLGNLSSTFSGKICQRWDRNIPQHHEMKGINFRGEGISDAANNCRDPGNTGYLWCLTKETNTRWEPCILNDEDVNTGRQRNNINNTTHSTVTLLCDSERVIPLYFRCDGKFDCKDQSDEDECSYSVHPLIKTPINSNISSNLNSTSELELGSYFRCKTREWISIIAQCDGVIDCFDASDEIGCHDDTVGTSICTKEQFQCSDGDCIHISLVCNLREDCIDGSDEYCVLEQCSSLTEYRCNNGQCIPLEQRCNAIPHCKDGSDEIACDECQPDAAFHCDIVRCIPIRLKCDEYVHCEDGTDEFSCDDTIFNSCQDVWEAGYRKSGQYIMGGLQVECKFGDVLNNTISTTFNFDFKYHIVPFSWFEFTYAYFYNIPTTKEESSIDFIIFSDEHTNCTQQIKEVCLPTYEHIAALNGSMRPCFCGIFNYQISKNSDARHDSIQDCEAIADRHWTSFEYITPNSTEFHLINDFTDGYRMIFLKKDNFRVIPGSAICKQDYPAKSNEIAFACNINGKVIPNNLRCIFDIDENGLYVGCRDGSHLINCENFECPQNTVKCPDSYCIPRRFLCDGVFQCQQGEDEEKCGCHPFTNEILIIHDEDSVDGPDINKFARQFYTETNLVRVLSYKASRPLQSYGISSIHLEIRDKEIHHVPHIETLFECRYKIMAGKLLKSIHFINDGLKGVILVQSSEISKKVVTEMLNSAHVLESDIRIYRVTEQFGVSSYTKPYSPISNVTDIQVKRWRILSGIAAEYFSELCKISTKVLCSNGYKCASSKTCISTEQICDGFVHCLHGDDEDLCNFKCPDNCTCVGLIANCSATNFNLTMIHTIPKTTRHLDLSFNKKVSLILEDSLLNSMKLAILNLSSCDIEKVTRYAFDKMTNLRSLDLSFNILTTLLSYAFSSLKLLTRLDLRGNFQLSVIEIHAFDGLFNIQSLDLANAQLEKISADTFSGLTLKNLDLSNNKIYEFDDFAFRDSSVEQINFKQNDIKEFRTKIFTGLIGLKKLITPAFKFCCIRPNYVNEEDCYPQKNEFSSCDDLMRHSVLQFLIWLIGLTALLGNMLTIIYRLKYDRQRLKLGFGIFVTNLAAADFFMGMYLVVIAVADSAFRKRYIFVDDYWRHSVWCNMAGIMSTLSSEASVLFLCLITLDRILVIKFPFGGVKLSKDKAVACAMFTWLFSATIAIFPVVYEGYFNGKFYSKSGVCIALPLTRDRPPGWAYSLTIFVCLNFVTFVMVAVGQLFIFIELRKSAGIATSIETARKRDLKVARNLLLVVTTDFMCWFPIGVLGMLALAGYVISGEVYAWAAVFILPVNSALNPILYTLSSIIGSKNFSPSTEEQSLIQITRETGGRVLKCVTVGRLLISSKPFPGFRYINELSKEEVHIAIYDVLNIAVKLAQSLDSFHFYSLGIKPFNVTTVIVGIRNKKLTGVVKIKGEPFISYKSEDKTENINQLGRIIRSLITERMIIN